MGSTSVRLVVDGVDIDEVEELDLSDDVLAVPDSCSVTIVDYKRKYRDKLKEGQSAQVYLANTAVNGGSPSVRFDGIIMQRKATGSPGRGQSIALTIQDRGVHLTGCAPLWYNLKKASYADLVDPASPNTILDQSFGFRGVRFDNDVNRRLKLGLAAVAAASQRVIDPIFAIQIEPGDTYLDKIVELCRRLNLLVNVSVDGVLQCFLPNYDQASSYSIRNTNDGGDGNVLSYEMTQDASKLYTLVECVGEQVGYEGSQDPNDPNAAKKRGAVRHSEALPFRRALTFSDPEMYQRGLAQKAAEWKFRRSRFDHFVLVVEVPEHFQVFNGVGHWWTSDSMADVACDDTGVYGRLYVQSVRLRATKSDGDTTTVTLRLPGLLSAAFGEIPAPPIILSSGVKGTPDSEGD